MSIPSYDIENKEQLRKLCIFLRSREGPAVREASMVEVRVYFLKGEELVSFLVEPKQGTKWPSDLPRLSSRHEALRVCKGIYKGHYLVRVEESREAGVLGVSCCCYFFRVPSNGHCCCCFSLSLLLHGIL